jgi:integrase
LIGALPERDRALWASALYAGLRRGELQALRWSDVDLAEGVIRVERGWDERVGPVAPKSRAGRRRVPLCKPLRS